MAGEKKGKAYEALVHVALQELVDAKKLAGPLHWNVTPEAMSIEPDFMTGGDPDNPKTILLLTYSGSSKESEKKMWRNFGELVEAKTVLADMPRVYALTIGIIKSDLENVQRNAFDEFVWVRQDVYAWADNVESFISHCVLTFPKGKEAQVGFMKDELRRASSKVKGAFRQLKSLLEEVYSVRSKALDRMWADHRSRTIPASPSARNTYLRRGASKARIFEDLDVAYRLHTGQSIDADSLPQYIYDLGLAKKITVGDKGIAKPTDREILNAVKLLDAGIFNEVVESLQSDKVTEYLNSLRNLDRYGAISKYLSKEFRNLTKSNKLAAIFRELHRDPSSVSIPGKNPISWPPNSVWLVEFLFDLVRAHEKSGNSFGIAQLGREVVDAGFGSTADLNSASQFGGGFGLSAWIDRKSSSGFRDDLVDGVAYIFSQRLEAMGRDGASSALIGIRDSAARSLIESKLVTYKMYEPIWLLVKLKCPRAEKVALKSCFGERSDSTGKAGQTTVARSRNTLVNWQSAHGSHTNDKKKELCGRAIGLRYHWNGRTFLRRPGIEKMILVLDGTWKQEDLNALLRAGWDEIFYPDEMDELAKAIV